MNDEKWRSAGLTFCLARVPRRVDSARQTTPIDGVQPRVPDRLAQNNSEMSGKFDQFMAGGLEQILGKLTRVERPRD